MRGSGPILGTSPPMIGTAMHSQIRKPFAIAAAVVLLGLTAACGGDTEDDEGTGDTTEDITDDANEQVGGTRVATLEVLDGWAELHPDARGLAEVTAGDETTIELSVAGLEAETEYPAHVHDGSCDADPPGGAHWQLDTEGDQGTPNHIHTYVVTDAEGVGEMTDTSDLIADDRAVSIVVHVPGTNEQIQEVGSDRILCGDLEDA